MALPLGTQGTGLPSVRVCDVVEGSSPLPPPPRGSGEASENMGSGLSRTLTVPPIDVGSSRLSPVPHMSQNCLDRCFFGESGREPVWVLFQTGNSILYPKGGPVGSGGLIFFCICPGILGWKVVTVPSGCCCCPLVLPHGASRAASCRSCPMGGPQQPWNSGGVITMPTAQRETEEDMGPGEGKASAPNQTAGAHSRAS